MKKLISNKRALNVLASIKYSIAENQHHDALKSSLLIPAARLTDQTYSHFIKSGHVFDTFLATSLVSHFSKAGDLSRSQRFLYDAFKPDTVAFNALLSGYAHFGLNCFSLCKTMLSDYAIMPDRFSLRYLIKSCVSFDEVRVAHVICVKLGFDVSGLISKYGKLGFVGFAEKCFEECFELDSFECTSMINGFVWNCEFDKAKRVFRRIRELGLELSEFSLTAVVGALREVKEGEIIHGLSIKLGFLYGGSLHLSNVIMNMYGRCGSRSDARKVFDESPDPDVVSWTARIGVASDGGEALEVLKFMHLSNLGVNELAILNVLSAIDDPKLLVGARQVHTLCQKGGYMSVISVCNALISLYGRCRVMGEARLVFDEMGFHDSISWNSLIWGYSDNGLLSPALKVFSQMRCMGLRPDQYTLASVLGAIDDAEFTVLVMQTHSYMIKSGLILDGSMLSCLISSYGKSCNLDCAKRVLTEVEEINVGHLKVMAGSAITACSPADAIECFKSSMRLFSEMDADTLSIVLKACSILTNLELGKAIHCVSLKSGLESDKFVETAIVDFYCKCGSISDAKNIFLYISSRNLAAWNAMIMGYAQQGFYNEAIVLFAKMTDMGIKPDEITYLGILQSCCHAGLVKEAQIHLNSMYELHGLVPSVEHYASIVDMLGRLGLVKEAKLVIDQMPLTPDAHILRSLLSACNNAGDLEIGEVAAKELLKLDPENDTAYTLLSKLYGRGHDWDNVRKLRRDMNEKSTYKEPGSSWTDIVDLCLTF